MEKILFVDACVRQNSRTKLLAQHLLQKMNGDIEEVNLERENIQPLNAKTLQERDALLKAKDYSADVLKYARQFAAADTVVIAAPYWDLSFPAMVKNYFEAVTAQGVTFYYDEEGIPQSLCKTQRVIYVMTAGGPIAEFNFGFDYVKGLCQVLYGIKDVSCYQAEMLDVIGMDVEGILKQTMEEIDRDF